MWSVPGVMSVLSVGRVAGRRSVALLDLRVVSMSCGLKRERGLGEASIEGWEP
jgi:hypothetical protein